MKKEVVLVLVGDAKTSTQAIGKLCISYTPATFSARLPV